MQLVQKIYKLFLSSIMLSKKEFKKLNIIERYTLLKKDGEYIGGRFQGAHRRYLFLYNKYYVELWQIISLDQVQWIEIQENKTIISEYVEKINLDDLW